MNDILIMCVGGNPLPAYVVIKFLCEKPETHKQVPCPSHILFLFSDKTLSVEETIVSQVNALYSNSIKPIRINIGQNERNLVEIDNQLQIALDQITDIASIHMNYTGGTKPMVVQAYITTRKFVEEHKIDLYMSDLDPENFKLILTVNQPPGTFLLPETKDLRDDIKPTVETIFNLHQEITIASTKPDLNVLYTEQIVSFLLYNWDKKEITTALEHFRELRHAIQKKEWKINFKKILSPELKIPRGNDFILNYELFYKCLDTLGISGWKTNLKPFHQLEKKQRQVEIRTWYEVAEFLSGAWLENLIFSRLQKINQQNPQQPIFDQLLIDINLVIEKRSIQIDIIATRGYQLFLISVTTESELGLVKLKCFEALFRAEQLGGLHAKVAVISMVDEINLGELKKDLREFNAAQNCRLIGRDALLREIAGESTNTLTQLLNSYIYSTPNQ